MIETRVCIDDTLGPYDAKLDPADRWNGALSPYFTLDTVRQLAARTQEMAEERGHDTVDTIHVVDGDARREGEPRTAVVSIRRCYVDEYSESDTEIIQPSSEGLYGVGSWEWTWQYVTWSCACGSDTPWHETCCKSCGLPRPEGVAAHADGRP
jgi:hypothetical protein